MKCSICLSNNSKQPYKVYCSNNHSFHINCMKKWYSSHNNCPICREIISRNYFHSYNLRSKIINKEKYINIEKEKFEYLNDFQDYIKLIKNYILEFAENGDIRYQFFLIYKLFCIFVNRYNVLKDSYPELLAIIINVLSANIVKIIDLKLLKNMNYEMEKLDLMIDKLSEYPLLSISQIQ